eukprot:1092891_1
MATHQTAMNLDRLVGCLNILNIDNDSSTIRAPYQQLLTDDKVNHESFIVSNADEELLILVEFTQIVSLRSMKVYYVPNVKGSDDMDVSGPKQIHVYLVKDLNKNFDDLEQLTPHKSKRCKEENLSRGQIIKLKQPKKTQKLIIYIASNHGDTEKTSINSISFKGDFVQHKNNNQASEKVRNEVTECKECSQQNFTPIIPPLKNTSIHLKRITEHKVNADHSNTHCFRWTFDSLPEFQRFIHAPVNDVTFRSDYHIIDGWVFYFEITPNGTTDRVKVDAGSTNVWLNLHKSIEGKPYVKVRFQCVCINEHMSFIGECDALLGTADCKDTTVTMAAISTTNAMRFSSFKHLEKLSFDCYVTLNPKTFQFQMGKKDTADRYEATDNATNDDPMLVAKDKIVKSQQAKPTISDIGGHRDAAAKHSRRAKSDTDKTESAENVERPSKQANKQNHDEKEQQQRPSDADEAIDTADVQTEATNNQQTKPEIASHSNTDGEINSDTESCLTCDGNIKQCKYLTHLKHILTEYKNKHCCDASLYEIVKIRHHLSFEHCDDNHNDFEYITQQMRSVCACDVSSCVRLKRNYRDRNNNDHHTTSMDAAKQQIVDGIHCYFVHSIDMGHRLNSNQRAELENIQTEEKKHADDNDTNNVSFRNRIFEKYRQFRAQAAQRIKNHASLFAHRYNKFSEFRHQAIDNKAHSSYYSYGQLFFYVPNKFGVVNVLPRFESLKQEMLDNALYRMTVEQWSCEYDKARAKFKSRIRRNKHPGMILKHILALMIYCNFDSIQHEFSKTFRGDDICKHNQFYHFGYYLYVAVNGYGTVIAPGDVLYHGVNAQTTFPDVIGPEMGIKINCPLSTSSSLAVAARFITGDRGLLVQFGGSQLRCEGFQTKYFAVEWLSDFQSERERLFIGTTAGLCIRNVTSDPGAIHYIPYIQALRIMQERIKLHGSGCFINYGVESQIELSRIVENQLSKTLPNEYEPLAMLVQDPYAQSLIDMYCKGRSTICLQCRDALDPTCFTRYFYPNIAQIQHMFPNVKDIVLCGVNKSDMQGILDRVLNIWSDIQTTLRLEIVRIYPNTADLNNGQTIEEYVNSIIFLNPEGFTQNGHIIKSHDNNKCIILLLHSQIIEPEPVQFGMSFDVLFKQFKHFITSQI